MTSARLVARAVELDDDQPDDVCPGCGQDITGWQRFDAHYPPDVTPTRLVTEQPAVMAARTVPLPWTTLATNHRGADYCPWTADYLAARAHRRRLIAQAVP